VALIKPDGSYTIVLDARDGLQGPTSIAIRNHTIYVLSAAFLTHEAPNILVADFGIR
jgi:hypothetical protein